jgi:hypothetical protein
VSLGKREPTSEDVPEGFPARSVKRAREHSDEEIKRIQEKSDVSREIAERILEESQGGAEPP